MADSNFVLARGFNATAALTKARAVKAHASLAETVIPITAATDKAMGVAEFSVSAAEILLGKGVTVHMAGIVEMECSAAVAVGDIIGMATDGRAKVAASTERVIGLCVGNASAGAGERISVLLGLPGNILV